MARGKPAQQKSGCLSTFGWLCLILVLIALFSESREANHSSPDSSSEKRSLQSETDISYNWTEEQIITYLSTIDGIVDIEAVTKDNDPNHELNQPGGYISTVFFTYDLIDQKTFPDEYNAIEKGTAGGGCVELFATKKDAANRSDYLSRFRASLSGYNYVIDTAVIRTSGKLTKSQSQDLTNRIVAELTGNEEVSQHISEQGSTKNSGRNGNILFIILFCLTIIAIGFFVFNRCKKNKKEREKQARLQSLRTQAYQYKDAVLNAEMMSEKAESIDSFISSWDDMMSNLISLKNYPGTQAYNDINPSLFIQNKQSDFQWKLRNAIERNKHRCVKVIRTEYKNSKEHRTREYQLFCNSIQKISDRLSDETKEFADKAADEIYQVADLAIPRIDLFPEGYSTSAKFDNLSHISLANNSSVSIKDTDGMDGHEFEYWCANLLKANGFNNVTVTQGSGDQGIDILAEKGGIRYAIQCKCYSGKLGNTPIQEAHTGKDYYHCHVGVVMTNSYFTSSAIKAAARTNILLWDRDKLSELLNTTSNV